MTRSVKVALALLLLTFLGGATIGLHRHRVAQAISIAKLYDGVRPVPANAPGIPAPVLKQLINADFAVVTNLRDVPALVKDSFCMLERCNYTGSKFDMVNPGERMSTDYMIEGVPNRRLVFAALNRESAIVVYQRGGFANMLCAAILDFRDGSAWGSTLNNYHVRNMHDLRLALAQEEYKDWRDGNL